jgi:WD40 repeat protein
VVVRVVTDSSYLNHVAWNIAEGKFAGGFDADYHRACLSATVVYARGFGAGKDAFFDLTTGKTTERETGRNSPLYDRLLLSPDGKTLAASLTREATGKDEQIALVNPANGDVLSVLDKGSPSRFAFSADGKLLAAVKDGRKIKLWNLADKIEVPTVADESYGFLALADYGKWLVTEDICHNLHLTEVGPAQTQKKVNLGQGHTGKVIALACSPTAPLFASVGANGEALLRDLTTGDVRARLPGHTGEVRAVGFTPDGKRLVTAGEDKLLKVWEIGDLAPPGEAAKPVLPGPARPRPGLAFAPDGKTLAYGGDTKAINLWGLANTLSPPELVAVLGQGYEINAVAFSPNSRSLAAAGKGANDAGELKLWDVKTLDAVSVVEKASAEVKPFTGVAFTPDGKTLAAAGGMNGRAVYFWDVTAKALSVWTGPPEDDFKPAKVVFSPDGQLWAAAGLSYNQATAVTSAPCTWSSLARRRRP